MSSRYNFWVYIMASKRNGTLYIGMTNNIQRRVVEHLIGKNEGFTHKYKVYRLVYIKHYQYVNDAISVEKEIKLWSRERKIALIEKDNPEWIDYSSNYFEPGSFQDDKD